MTGNEKVPEKGERVAWVTRHNDKTSGLSSVHRVFEGGKTYCSVVIPAPDRLFPPLKSLNVCSRCEALNKRAAAYEKRAVA